MIQKYEDSFYVRFDEGGDTYKGITKLPHYKEWTKIISYLKKRGFEIKTCKYHIENNYGQALNKVAIKGNVVFILECMGSQIKIDWGDVKNLWDNENNFWSLTDDRSKQLTYLEGKKVELEVNKLLNIFPQEKIINHDNSKLSAEEIIIRDLNSNSHIHGKIKCLEDIKLSIESGVGRHNQGRNSLDRDKKEIICGDLKYYYNYDKRLCCGIAWHHINNMWWMLTPDGNRNNISSYSLFDYNGESRRKQLTKEQKINRLESELKKYESKKNYIRCISINKQIEKLKSTEKLYYVWSLKHNSWWGANNGGYTNDKRYAGIYLESNILASQSYYNNGVSTKAILIV